jgi:hypothetical protein
VVSSACVTQQHNRPRYAAAIEWLCRSMLIGPCRLSLAHQRSPQRVSSFAGCGQMSVPVRTCGCRSTRRTLLTLHLGQCVAFFCAHSRALYCQSVCPVNTRSPCHDTSAYSDLVSAPARNGVDGCAICRLLPLPAPHFRHVPLRGLPIRVETDAHLRWWRGGLRKNLSWRAPLTHSVLVLCVS